MNGAPHCGDRATRPGSVLSGHLSFTYNGQIATVIAVQLAPSSLQNTRVGAPNAFGEAINEDDIDDPYMDVFVTFEDGSLGSVRGYPITLVPEHIELASGREDIRKHVEAILQNAVGHDLYAVGYSRIYKPTATVDEMSGPHEILARLPIGDLPMLEPLVITKAKYIPETRSVIFKLRLPSGSEGIAYTSPQFIDDHGDGPNSLSQISGLLLTSIPSNLTPKEIKAIKEISVFRGMSTDALDYALGFKDSENDWGKGGKQRIYFGGKLIVYIDNSGKVEEWQHFE